jgi:uncharacterized Fe-S radical SAM superfamily protein PflX
VTRSSLDTGPANRRSGSAGAAAGGGLRLPIVYNTSAYDSLDSLRLMDGVVDVYMPDFKVWSQPAARRYLRRPDYAEVARAAVKEMAHQVGPLVSTPTAWPGGDCCCATW